MYYRTAQNPLLTEASVTVVLLLLALSFLVLPRLFCYLWRRPGCGVGYQILQAAGWLLMMAAYIYQARAYGLLLPSFCVLAGGGLIAAMFVEQHRRSQREMLLAMIATAIERKQPLTPVLEMFGQGAVGWTGEAGTSMAQALESGVPLDTALQQAGDPLGDSAGVLVRMGREVDDLGAALAAIDDIQRQTGAARRAFTSRCCYLAAVATVMLSVIAIAMAYLVPSLGHIFRDYKLDLPQMTQLTLKASNLIAGPEWELFGMPFSWLTLPIALLGVYAGLRFVGSSRGDLARGGRLVMPLHRACILEALALAADNGRPLEPATALLTAIYPRRWIRVRLARAHASMLQGTNWPDSLRQARLLRKTDVGALAAAQRQGNLAWTMRELAAAARRRLLNRAQTVSHVVFPILLAGLGMMVGFIVISLFLPMIVIINALT